MSHTALFNQHPEKQRKRKSITLQQGFPAQTSAAVQEPTWPASILWARAVWPPSPWRPSGNLQGRVNSDPPARNSPASPEPDYTAETCANKHRRLQHDYKKTRQALRSAKTNNLKSLTLINSTTTCQSFILTVTNLDIRGTFNVTSRFLK